ncbi:MAG: hypothetical protein QOE73_498, partial [Verrucomicrobiota bacterium]
MSAKAERIINGHAHLLFFRDLGSVVEIALRIG